MIVYPAIDIKNGKCVRLKQGLANQQTVYFENPIDAAKMFVDANAKWIHIVNLDGAFDAKTSVLGIVEKICAMGVKVQLGGGMRDVLSVKAALECGVSRTVIGTKACTNPEFVSELVSLYAEKIAVGIDAKGSKVATNGWIYVSDKNALDFALDMAKRGVKTVIYTDIDTDGMLTGPNIAAQSKMLEKTLPFNTSVIASGGIASGKDILALNELAKKYPNLNGAITGKAVYEGKITQSELKRFCTEL